MVVRSYDDELQYLERISPHCWRIKKGFQPNMKVEGVFYVNSHLEKLMLEELKDKYLLEQHYFELKADAAVAE